MKKIASYSAIIALVIVCIMPIQAQFIEMIDVSGATIELGATTEQQPYSYPKEFPAHRVKMPDFMIGKYEITQNQWIAIMGDNPSLNGSPNATYPVEYIDWMSAIIFCNEATLYDATISNDQLVYYKDAAFTQAFSKADYDGDGNTKLVPVYIDYSKTGYRLPSEAEWEFAARGGLNDSYTLYAGSNVIGNVAIYTQNSGWDTQPVGQKDSNSIGAYDMSGNVWEYCNDWYGQYPSVETMHPKGPETGTHRVVRGGAYDYTARMCRTASRYMAKPDDKDSDIGFRVARTK